MVKVYQCNSGEATGRVIERQNRGHECQWFICSDPEIAMHNA